MRLLFLMLASAAMLSAAVPVWIDTDPSVTRGGHEVDDGLALVQAFHSSALAVRGVSVVFGNAPLKKGLPIARRLVHDFGPPGLAVHSGAASAEDLGIETDAVRALTAALRREELTILMLGPATNVATVLRNRPELRNRVKRIVAVAGRRPNQRFSTAPSVQPFRDLNFELDAPGLQVLLDSGVPLVLTPWEISSKIWIRSADLTRVRASNPLTGWVIDAAEDWLKFWKTNLASDGFNPFDTLAVGYAISSNDFRCDRFPLHIVQGLDDTATGAAAPQKPYLLAAPSIHSKYSALYCSEAPPSFQTNLIQLLAESSVPR